MKKMSEKINLLRKINWYLMKKFNFGLKRDYPFRTSTIFAKEYFKGKDDLIAIEIGIHRGESAEYFLNKIPFIKKLYCIDPYDKNFVIDGEFAPIHFNIAKKRLRKFSHKCEFIKETSDNALKILKQKGIKADFVYIDGLHTYEQVKRDIKNYFPLVKGGGIISGHDIQNEEVTKAIFEFCCKNRIIPLIKEMDWIIVKKSKNPYDGKGVSKKIVGDFEMKNALEKIDLWQKDIKEGDNILDIGCWGGSRLKKLQGNVFGMEIDENKINLAEPKIKKRIKLGDVTKEIPYNKKFDWIFLTEVLEHVLDDSKALANINKSLKKRGNLILTTPRSIKYFEFWDPAWFRWKFLWGKRHYHYTKKELFGKLNNNGFKIKEYYIMGNLSWVLVRWINVFLRYGLKSKRQINHPMRRGFCDWIILAKKAK